MSFLEGSWKLPFDSGDETIYPNHRTLGELGSEPVDIVVVGGGGAGAAAAIEAADLGASVVILEACASPGGNTQVSGGTIRLLDDAPRAVEHVAALAQGATPRAVIESFVAGVAEIPAWVESLGATLEARATTADAHGRVFPVSRPGSSFPNFPGAEGLGRRALVPPRREGRVGGAALWDLLAEGLSARGVPLVCGARVSRLSLDASRRVTGVEVASPDGPVSIRATRGVVLACGGFAYDDELMTQYYGLPLPTVCLPGRATGDGVRLAQEAGADLWHMNAVAASVGYRPPGLVAGIQAKMPDYGFVLVDQLARRYVCETELENHSAIFAMTAQDSITGEFLRTPSYLVFDDRTRAAGTLAHLPHGANRHYPWSKDNLDEVERGWFARAGGLRELGTALGLQPTALESCVAQFNEFARSGMPDPLGRPTTQLRAIEEPPFYGAAVYPIIVNTQGGPRRDEQGRILGPDRSPIPGLYGAGELGSVWNRLYPGAGNLSECLASGRLAAKSALA